jgi:hypothetical protein
VVINMPGLIVSENALEAVPPAASVSVTVKFDVPAVVGVPLSTPAELKVKPAGNVPEVTDQL